METIERTLSEYIAEALAKAGASSVNFSLEYPADPSHGDYATNAALVAAKGLQTIPRALGSAIAEHILAKNDPNIRDVTVAGPGFVNISLVDDVFVRVLGTIAHARMVGKRYGGSDVHTGEISVFDYTDPNPFKVFHIGHLMANAIGESLARLSEFSGAKVVRVCYGGDVGLHVAKTIYGVQHGDAPFPSEDDPLSTRTAYLGAAYVKGASAYEDDPGAKAEIDGLNKVIFAKSDPDIMRIYEAGKRWSVEGFHEMYRTLGTTFDHERFESDVMDAGVAAVRANIGRVFSESEGAVVYEGDPETGLHTRVFLTKEGLPTYEAKEIGNTEWKFAMYPDLARSVVVTANEQDDYFRVIYAALVALHPEWNGKLFQVGHGMMRFAEGKMSSRKGNVISGAELLDELTARIAERYPNTEGLPDELAGFVAVAAVKFQVLKQATGKDIIFDKEQSISFDGDSGPYLQYTHARIASIERKAADAGVVADFGGAHHGIGELERLLARFPKIVQRAEFEGVPHYVANYLLELARSFNSYYASTIILDGASEAPYKLALAGAVRVVLEEGLWILGISAPDRM